MISVTASGFLHIGSQLGENLIEADPDRYGKLLLLPLLPFGSRWLFRPVSYAAQRGEPVSSIQLSSMPKDSTSGEYRR